MNNSRARAWCWTLNNPTDEEVTKIQSVVCQYLVYGHEEVSTKHLQGYIYFENAKSLSAIRGLVSERAHFERAKGTPVENRAYCTKDGHAICEKGVLPKQGKRTDIQDVVETIRSGGTMRSILDVATSYQSARMGELALKYLEVGRVRKPEVYWFWGPTGTGKTYAAQEEIGTDPAPYWVYDGKWWCGYDGHLNVIWDEFRADQVKFTRLLRLLDCYPIAVETKGGNRQLKFEKIIITSCKSPLVVYDKGDEEVAQLTGRIKEVRHFSGINRRKYLHRGFTQKSGVILFPDPIFR